MFIVPFFEVEDAKNTMKEKQFKILKPYKYTWYVSTLGKKKHFSLKKIKDGIYI